LGYTEEYTDKAAKYQKKLAKGMKAEAKAEREQAKLEKEAAIEKRREERKRTEDGTEPARPQGTDTVQISEAAKTALKNRPVEAGEPADSDPVIYTAAGETVSSAENESTVSFSA